MRGWESVTTVDLERRGGSVPKPSKYRNVRIVVDGITFDSKREAVTYSRLKLREKAGEISELHYQMPFNLFAPMLNSEVQGGSVVVAQYIADFTYQENGALVVVDAKGKRTQMYALKAKWLMLQSGIQIQEV